MARSESRGRPEERALVAELNPAQRRAVLHGRGPLLIIAGAGTGKTKVITHRIARLIAAKAARPNEILAVTFTEKAANEMEARVDVLVPYTSSFAEISTFNSFGERVLRECALDIGYPPDFRLLDDVEQAIFFREHLFRLPLDYYRPLGQPTRHIQELLEAIRRLKQEDVRPEDYVRFAEELGERASGDVERETARKHLEVAGVYAGYQALLRTEGLIDFEDHPAKVTVDEREHMLAGDGFAEYAPAESLRNYYLRSSYGKLDIRPEVLGIYHYPGPRSAIDTSTDAAERQLVEDAFSHFDQQGHDFSVYDADADGRIDSEIVF
ncbi:MAG: UvrD-helicase domain-containing protein, partial [Candidatus Aminicenantes bacterium]|nr:UvrD-helicase domain-containing protein [Candidatus Aminicenantes bacterium]